MESLNTEIICENGEKVGKDVHCAKERSTIAEDRFRKQRAIKYLLVGLRFVGVVEDQ